jgi:hypothetical protein
MMLAMNRVASTREAGTRVRDFLRRGGILFSFSFGLNDQGFFCTENILLYKQTLVQVLSKLDKSVIINK